MTGNVESQNEIQAMMNIGHNPTFEGDAAKTIEIHIFDFSGDIYGQQVRVSILKYLRAERRFSDVSELISQMEVDKIQALNA